MTRRSGRRQPVAQDVVVGRHHGVADLHDPAGLGVRGTDEPQHRGSRGQTQQPRLVGGGHTRFDLLGEVVQPVAQLLEAGVDAARPWVGLADGGALHQLQWQPGRRYLDGLPVGEVAAVAPQHVAAWLDLEACGDFGRGRGGAHVEDFDLGGPALGLRLGEEGSAPGFAVLAREAVLGQAADRRSDAHERAAAVLYLDQALGAEDRDGLADRAARGAVAFDELGFGGQPVAWAQLPGADRMAEVVGDLAVDRPVTGGVDRLGQLRVTLPVDWTSRHSNRAHRMSAPRHSVSVAAAVVRGDGRILVIQRRDNDKWEPPGGVLELDEGIHEGLVREVLEETGLAVQPGPLTGVYKNVRRGIVALVFLCGYEGEAAVDTAEAATIAWLTPDEISARMDEAYAVRLLDALEPGPPTIREHDGVSVLP